MPLVGSPGNFLRSVPSNHAFGTVTDTSIFFGRYGFGRHSNTDSEGQRITRAWQAEIWKRESGVTSWDLAQLLQFDLTVFDLLLYFSLHLSTFAPFSPFLTGVEGRVEGRVGHL